MQSRSPIWLDCDPGYDDAFAILLAAYAPNLRLLGISTVHGNASVESTTANALNITNISGLNYLPVVTGASKPLLRAGRSCPEIHGASGLALSEGVSFPPLPSDRKAVSAKAVNYMYHIISNHFATHPTERITIIATGALTNIALLLSLYPEVKRCVKEIVFMGGSCGRGNLPTPMAEYNMAVDPEAAAIVVAAGEGGLSGIAVTMVPLDVTHSALVTARVLRSLSLGIPYASATSSSSSSSSSSENVSASSSTPPSASLLFPFSASSSSSGSNFYSPSSTGVDAGTRSGSIASAITPFRKILCSLMGHFGPAYEATFGMPEPPLHDPVAVMFVIDRAIFKTRTCRVDVELANPLSAGQTIVDLNNVCRYPKDKQNVTVALSMIVPTFWRTLLESVTAADSRSILNAPMGAAGPFSPFRLTSQVGGTSPRALAITQEAASSSAGASQLPFTPVKGSEAVASSTATSAAAAANTGDSNNNSSGSNSSSNNSSSSVNNATAANVPSSTTPLGVALASDSTTARAKATSSTASSGNTAAPTISSPEPAKASTSTTSLASANVSVTPSGSNSDLVRSYSVFGMKMSTLSAPSPTPTPTATVAIDPIEEEANDTAAAAAAASQVSPGGTERAKVPKPPGKPRTVKSGDAAATASATTATTPISSSSSSSSTTSSSATSASS